MTKIKFDKLKPFLTSVISLFAAIIIAIIVLCIVSKNPAKVINSYFLGVFSSKFYIGTILSTGSLLLFSSLGSSIALKSGNMNLGGAAQIYLGGFLAAIILKNPQASFWGTFLICGIVPAIVASLSALLKIFKNVSEILTSFLISAAITPFIDYAVAGPLRDSSKNLLATESIADNHKIASLLPPSAFNATFFIAVFLCIFAYFFYKYNYIGKSICLCEHNLEFAMYCGYNTNAIAIGSMLVSGFFHGITGFFAIVGNYHTCHSGFYAGMNWDAISMALIAQNNPFLLIPVTLLMSYIYTSGTYTSIMYNFNFELNSLVQGVIIFTISAKFFVKNKDKIKTMQWHNFRFRGE